MQIDYVLTKAHLVRGEYFVLQNICPYIKLRMEVYHYVKHFTQDWELNCLVSRYKYIKLSHVQTCMLKFKCDVAAW